MVIFSPGFGITSGQPFVRTCWKELHEGSHGVRNRQLIAWKNAAPGRLADSMAGKKGPSKSLSQNNSKRRVNTSLFSNFRSSVYKNWMGLADVQSESVNAPRLWLSDLWGLADCGYRAAEILRIPWVRTWNSSACAECGWAFCVIF